MLRKLNEAGYAEAIHGLALNKKQPDPQKLVERQVPETLAACGLGEGHDKFLEMIVVWLEIRAPLYWWKQFDTYRVGVTKQSESTMHTLMKHPIAREAFSSKVPALYLNLWLMNQLREAGQFETLIAVLPEGYLQRRAVMLSYKSLKTILKQRQNHKLEEWREFCQWILKVVDHPELLEAACQS